MKLFFDMAAMGCRRISCLTYRLCTCYMAQIQGSSALVSVLENTTLGISFIGAAYSSSEAGQRSPASRRLEGHGRRLTATMTPLLKPSSAQTSSAFSSRR